MFAPQFGSCCSQGLVRRQVPLRGGSEAALSRRNAAAAWEEPTAQEARPGALRVGHVLRVQWPLCLRFHRLIISHVFREAVHTLRLSLLCFQHKRLRWFSVRPPPCVLSFSPALFPAPVRGFLSSQHADPEPDEAPCSWSLSSLHCYCTVLTSDLESVRLPNVSASFPGSRAINFRCDCRRKGKGLSPTFHAPCLPPGTATLPVLWASPSPSHTVPTSLSCPAASPHPQPERWGRDVLSRSRSPG